METSLKKTDLNFGADPQLSIGDITTKILVNSLVHNEHHLLLHNLCRNWLLHDCKANTALYIGDNKRNIGPGFVSE